ncbi:MAG: hypothetical protein M3362_05680 [Acidobacteriota bacterium]|nr:hypothetical protein [Acidobacteriota bacterium]
MAGLDITGLARLLEGKKIECALVEGDAAFDHCVLRLSSVMRPGVVAFLEYENQGVEPRLASLIFQDDKFMPRKDDYPLEWEKTLKLEGARKDDADKIAGWVEREYLSHVS